jgi:alkanesulfonate monooxygenase
MGAATYWLYPFRSYKTFCPYLVGSFEQVSGTLEAYLRSGVTTIVLDEPQNEEDIASAMKSIAMATSRV